MSILKRIRKSKILLGLLVFSCAGIFFVLGFHTVCRSAQPDFVPIDQELAQEHQKAIEPYQRPEESTYLTFPEWHSVFTPQEYGKFLKEHPPSTAPYFGWVRQFWSGYCEVYGATSGNYPFNGEYHMTMAVIGVSTSVEYGIKGMYEHTLGALFEWIGKGERTEEEEYAARVAAEYGAFIPHRFFYEFPYGKRLVGLWKETSLWGSRPIRKWERKIIVSMEYAVKIVFNGIMRAAHTIALGGGDSEIFAIVTNAPESFLNDNRIRKIQELDDGSVLIAIPHYQGFTDIVPELAKAGMDFVTIAGNDEILVTILAPRDASYDLPVGTVLFKQHLLTGAPIQRTTLQIPVKDLALFLREVKSQGAIEHLFDY